MTANSLNIFILDDGMELCRDLRVWLEEDGHCVSCYSASLFWTSDTPATPPDLLIYGLPQGTGEELALYQRVTTFRLFRHVPRIVVSRDSSLEYEMLDVFDFQVRPFDRTRFLTGIKRLYQPDTAAQLHVLPGDMLQPFRDFLDRHSGLHFSQNNQRILQRGLLRRMQALQINCPDNYLDFLTSASSNYDELNKLLGLLTAGVE